MAKHTKLILTLFMISLLAILVAPRTHALSEINPGTTLTYEIFIYDRGNETTILKTYQILSVRSVGGKTNITWKTETKQGYWIGESFGNPVVIPGEKWTIVNQAYYTTVGAYKSLLNSKKTLYGSKACYYFRMKFIYFKVFKGIPRYGKSYRFIGYIKASENRTYYKLVHNITYFANGVAYEIFYEEWEDVNADLTISDNERYCEVWRLIDWNLPWYTAISPVVRLAAYLTIFVLVVMGIRYVVRKYAPRMYKSREESK